MNLLKRRALLKKANYLELTPIRIITEEVDDHGKVTLLMPKFINRFAKKYLTPLCKTPHTKLRLDVLGSSVWLTIDGQKTVAEITQEITQKFNAETEITPRLTQFLTLLYEQKIITFREVESSSHRQKDQ